MGSSSEISDAGVFSGFKLPEKTMFNQTCGLLREYLKEKKGHLGELNLGMTLGKASPEEHGRSKTPTTSNFFPVVEKSGGWNPKAMTLFHQQLGFGAYAAKQELSNMDLHFVNRHTMALSEKAQMTIFYAGEVIVFDDIPANKAKEIMHLASTGSSENSDDFFSTAFTKNNVFNSSISISNMRVNILKERFQNSPRIIDLPMARKASLTRFLEKRKDRINARAPYEVNGAFSCSSKSNDSKSWLRLSSQSFNADQ